MTFEDYSTVGELSLLETVEIYMEHGETIVGDVVGLTLDDKDPSRATLTLRLENGSLVEFDKKLSDRVQFVW